MIVETKNARKIVYKGRCTWLNGLARGDRLAKIPSLHVDREEGNSNPGKGKIFNFSTFKLPKILRR